MSLTRLWDKIKPVRDEPSTSRELKSEETIIGLDDNFEPTKRPLFRKLFLSFTIILIASLSFGLGRLSDSPDASAIKIDFDPAVTALLSPSGEGRPQTASVIESLKGNTNQVVPAPRSLGEVVASKNGTKYHFSDCPGAKQIKETNKIYFNSPKEAEASGFTLAANCKPN